jgi:hypothetical protein
VRRQWGRWRSSSATIKRLQKEECLNQQVSIISEEKVRQVQEFISWRRRASTSRYWAHRDLISRVNMSSSLYTWAVFNHGRNCYSRSWRPRVWNCYILLWQARVDREIERYQREREEGIMKGKRELWRSRGGWEVLLVRFYTTVGCGRRPEQLDGGGPPPAGGGRAGGG